jgi:hypothetical protein
MNIKSKNNEIGGVYSTHGKMRNAYNILVGDLKGRDHVEILGIHGRIILEWILGK